MAEKEYIEREAALEAVKKKRDYMGAFSFEEEDAWTVGFQQGITFALSDVAAIPAADVRPVVRGKWEEVDRTPLFDGMEEHLTYRCSSCRAYQFYDVFDNGTARYNFCPNCGADMREES